MMKLLPVWLFSLAVALTTFPVAAQDALPPAPYAYRQIGDPAKEAEARELMHTLRCVACQGQSIADSDAPMAGDMRHQVRSRIAAGESAEEVRAWLVSRYGDYISYRPTLGRMTWPLYVAPLFLVLVAGLIVWRRVGKLAVQG